jgi:uncharacterized protein (TIGR03086 family)
METIEAIEAAFAHTGRVIAGISQDQMTSSTPCSEWDLTAVLDHTTGVVAAFGGAVGGKASSEGADFAEISSNALEGWRSFDLSSSLDFPQPNTPGQAVAAIQLMDVCGHAWDLAKATGQDAEFAPELASAAMDAAQMIVSEDLRGGRFGPAVDAPGASVTDQFAAFLGRQP